MGYKYQAEVQQKARYFIRVLQSVRINARIIPDSFRDYSVKLSLSRGGVDLGRCYIYYKPKTDSFTLGLQELKDHILEEELEQAWYRQEAAVTCQGWHIYVDGSFQSNTIGYGAVIIQDGKVVEELSGTVDDNSFTEHRNIAGELFALRQALGWCRQQQISDVTVYYDYKGIEKWATGEWMTKQPLTREYAAFMQSCPVSITWQKVKGHTGNKWNDRADQLAKQGTVGKGPNTGNGPERLAQLGEKATLFTGFLKGKGLVAQLEKIYNEQYARILVQDTAQQRIAICDLYHTVKKPFTPYIHSCQSESYKHQLTMLWKEFHNGQLGF